MPPASWGQSKLWISERRKPRLATVRSLRTQRAPKCADGRPFWFFFQTKGGAVARIGTKAESAAVLVAFVPIRASAGWAYFSASASWHLQFGADMNRHFGSIIINEVADTVVRNSAELRPVSQGANRGLLSRGENAAHTQAGYVSELALGKGVQ